MTGKEIALLGTTPWHLRRPDITFWPHPRDIKGPWKPPPGYPIRSSNLLSLEPLQWDHVTGRTESTKAANQGVEVNNVWAPEARLPLDSQSEIGFSGTCYERSEILGNE